jgi:hypothetical protein
MKPDQDLFFNIFSGALTFKNIYVDKENYF